jgi:hypothetical protein
MVAGSPGAPTENSTPPDLGALLAHQTPRVVVEHRPQLVVARVHRVDRAAGVVERVVAANQGLVTRGS